jgi:AhpD family alkylhydroperoxidase
VTEKLIEYRDAVPEVRAIFDEILSVRGFETVPKFYRALAFDPPLLRRVWEGVRDVYRRGRIDLVTKEYIAIAVCMIQESQYCLQNHIRIARDSGMDDETFGELLQTIAAFSESSLLSRTLNIGSEL